MTLITNCRVLPNGQYAIVKFTMLPPNPRSWSPVLSRARLNVSFPGWPLGSAILTSVVSISVLEKGQSSFLKEKQVQTGDTIVLQAEQSLALPGFVVLQQSEICCSECNEELQFDLSGVDFSLLLTGKPVRSTTEEG